VHAVRLDRNAVIRLTNDHKSISQQMEQLLHKLHALARCAFVPWCLVASTASPLGRLELSVCGVGGWGGGEAGVVQITSFFWRH
jgi:hypothetical protein